MLFYLVASTIPKWRTFKFLRCVQHLNGWLDLVEVMYEEVYIDNDSYTMLFCVGASTISK
jgi:hypothetical protein